MTAKEYADCKLAAVENHRKAQEAYRQAIAAYFARVTATKGDK